MAIPFDARCGRFKGSANDRESRVSDVNVEEETVAHTASSVRPALEFAVRLLIEQGAVILTLYLTSCCSS